jgi:hypothetical protein
LKSAGAASGTWKSIKVAAEICDNFSMTSVNQLVDVLRPVRCGLADRRTVPAADRDSNMGSRTKTAAISAGRSRIAGTPNGRCFPVRFGYVHPPHGKWLIGSAYASMSSKVWRRLRLLRHWLCSVHRRMPRHLSGTPCVERSALCRFLRSSLTKDRGRDTGLSRYPPHRAVRALTSAYGSYLGWVAAKRALG